MEDLSNIDLHEEGEIVDDNSEDETLHKAEVIPTGTATKIFETYASDEEEYSDNEEPPEEVLNRLAQKIPDQTEEEEEEIDPALCKVCKTDPHKYKCPKCNIRTCSLACSKKHKEEKECDGVRGPYTVVQKLSQYSAQNSIEDQRFFDRVQNKVIPENCKPTYSGNDHRRYDEERTENNESIEHSDENVNRDNVELNADGTRSRATSAVERFLLPNAARRQIFLSFSNDKGEDCSRHEQFSDSIFWCIDFIFKKQMEDGSVSEYNYRVQNIPETIRICTVLKQFLKPRKVGCIVSESDLDVQKLKPFIEAGSENINLFMRVPRYEQERYYVVVAEKNMLDNTKNRVILDHPKIIIVLNNEFCDFQVLSEAEALDIRDRMQSERNSIIKQSASRGRNNLRGGHRGDSNGFRGGRGRGGFRGGYNDRRGGYNSRGGQGHPSKRGYSGNSDYDGSAKRGRGRGYRGYGRPTEDDFDPFEPFEGPVSLPMDYGKKDIKTEASCKEEAKPHTENAPQGFHATSNEVYEPRTNGSIFD
ncbi:unnamed protein product [Auanema sp. JU1783]|nr:unnamed protein product [Auanema sp. JU1783]